jgi:protein-S-isoprenylcysteine O-methyltransferase Ste14
VGNHGDRAFGQLMVLDQARLMPADVATLLRRLGSKVVLCTLYLVFAYYHLVDLVENGFRLSVALLVVFESVMVVLVLFRRDSSDVDLGPFAVFAGLVGSFAVLGFRPVEGAEDQLLGQAIQVIGVLLQLAAAVSLGRSFGVLPANRGIKSRGMYRVVRHPFYFSYLVTQAGYIMNNPSLRNFSAMAIGTGFQVLRIHYEERLLLRDETYRRYTEGVQWHLVPGVW